MIDIIFQLLTFQHTWFLNDSVAGSGDFLPLGFIGILIITEVAVYTRQTASTSVSVSFTVMSILTLSGSPLHDSQTLLSPGESAAPS